MSQLDVILRKYPLDYDTADLEDAKARMKPTKAQERALVKLTKEWQSAYSLREPLSTLELFNRKLADRKVERGAMFMPRNQILYRLPVQATDGTTK